MLLVLFVVGAAHGGQPYIACDGWVATYVPFVLPLIRAALALADTHKCQESEQSWATHLESLPGHADLPTVLEGSNSGGEWDLRADMMAILSKAA